MAMSHTLRHSVNQMLKFADASHAYSLWYSWLLNHHSKTLDGGDETDSCVDSSDIDERQHSFANNRDDISTIFKPIRILSKQELK